MEQSSRKLQAKKKDKDVFIKALKPHTGTNAGTMVAIMLMLMTVCPVRAERAHRCGRKTQTTLCLAAGGWRKMETEDKKDD